MLSTVAVVTAALFSYLGWVQMVQTSGAEIEEKLERYYEEATLSDKNSNYIIRPYSIRLQEKESLSYKIRRTVIPYCPIEGQTRMLLSIEEGNISPEVIGIVSKKHTQFECSMTDVGAISITVFKNEPEQVLEKMVEFCDLLSAVLGDPESTISPDLDYMFDESE